MHSIEEEDLGKQITIDGEFIENYNSITINQFLHKHHTFEVVLDIEAIEEVGSYTIDRSKAWLGKQFTTNVSGKAFVGIVLDISMSHDEIGLHGKLILKGLSQTVLLENGKQQKSWLETDLETVVNEIISSSGINSSVIPAYTNAIPYLCQYGESNYAYLQKLAHQYNEWFYFNGVELVFGKPESSDEEPIVLEYSKDLSDINIKIKTYNPNIGAYSYNALTDENHEGEFAATSDGLNSLQSVALSASQEIFPEAKDYGVGETFLQDLSSLDEYLEKRMQSINSGGNVIEASGTKKGLQIGSIVKIDVAKDSAEEGGDNEIQHYGEFIITQINHFADLRGSYSNKFSAVSSGNEGLPVNENIKETQASNQVAVVVSNEDPEGKGRVQVQFMWQVANGEKTDFIRVMTPDAGIGDFAPVNRGFVFIPEVGDQVMVGFEYNDPNRPFVMGSMFTGVSGEGGGEENNIKSMITRSGHTIELDDTEDAQKITIKDNDGSIIIFDTVEQSLTINATENIDIAAKNINITAEENITIGAQGDIEIAAEGDLASMAQGNVNIQSTGDTEVKSSGAVAIEATSDATLLGMNAIVEGKTGAEVNGVQTKVTGSAMTEVSGGIVKIN